MDLRRLRAGEWLAFAGGVALLVSLFTDWYGISVEDPGTSVELSSGFTAWQSFSVIDILLAMVAAAAIGLAVIQAVQTRPALPVAASVLTVVIGAAGVLLVVFRLIAQPGPNEFVDIRAGAWLGLAATAAITLGAWMAMADERVSHVPPGPEPELRRLDS
jgi:hypothetical protein